MKFCTKSYLKAPVTDLQRALDIYLWRRAIAKLELGLSAGSPDDDIHVTKTVSEDGDIGLVIVVP